MTRLRVGPAPGGGWDVKEPGSSAGVLARGQTQAEAISMASTLLAGGGAIEILDEGGFFVRVDRVTPSPQDPPASRWSAPYVAEILMLAGLFVGTGPVLRVVLGRVSGILWMVVGLQFALGVGLMVLGIWSRRRRRRALEAAARDLAG